MASFAAGGIKPDDATSDFHAVSASLQEAALKVQRCAEAEAQASTARKAAIEELLEAHSTAAALIDSRCLAASSKIAKQVSEFEEMKSAIGKFHFPSKIKLNVGGTYFTTGLTTITKESGSVFEAMFSGQFKVSPDEDDGAYFIDRNPKHFDLILDFLRGALIPSKLDESQREELRVEADFFQLGGLVQLLDDVEQGVGGGGGGDPPREWKAGGKELYDRIKANDTTLAQANLSVKGLTGNEAIMLGDALRHNTTLTHPILQNNAYCGLQNNQIGDAGAVGLGEGLKENSTLTYLDLSNNHIGDAQKAELMRVMNARPGRRFTIRFR